jgi:acyl-CoA synthetase (AMP-forming)/AMP-acid ligase II
LQVLALFAVMDTTIELRGSPLVEDTCETLIQRFQKSVADFPDELAVVCTHQSCDIYNLCETRLGEDERTNNANYLRLTYRSLDTGVKFFVKGLEALGAAVGSPLFVICPNQVEYVVTTLSAYQIGLVHVPLNPSNLSNVTEVKHMFQTVLDELHPTNAIIVAQNPKVAGDIDHINLQVGLMKVIVEGHLEGWESFKDVLELGRSTKEEHVKTSDHLDSEEFSVFFTSGTTSLPKGCLVKTARMMDVLEGALSISHTGPGKSIAVSLPNNHGFGHICLMLPLLRGACIVLAGPTFSSTAIIEAISQERCTHLPIVPSMAHAILRDESLHQRRIDSLEVLLFAGAPLPRDLLLQCRDVLRAGQVENFYGMTEGVFCCTGPVRELEQIVNDRYVAIGRPVRGSRIRICAPGELCAVQNGTVGEVHFAGDSMIHQYMGLKSNDIYYDDGRFWFKTGDQGFVDPDRRLFLVGRYKDLIIRGGENISPASIEAVMSSHHKLSTLEPQVVAGLDPIAGELPVAIVREGLDYSLIQELQSTVRSKLGAIYVPNTIISLRELGLNDYPRTMAGKVQKYKLKALVRKYCESRAQTSLKTRESRELADAVVEIWARVLGLLPSQIDICSPVLNVADSILLIKARDRIRKKTGRSIPLQQWNSAFTIADQITLLEQASSDEKKGSAEDTENRRLGPPPAEEIVHLRGDPDELEATKAAVERTIAKYKLTWDDVEDIFPATDLIYALSKSRVVNSWNVYASIVSKSASARVRHPSIMKVNLIVYSYSRSK